MNIKEIKSNGREAFKANYWRCVLVAFLLSLLVSGTAVSSGNTVRNANSTQAEQEVTDAVNALTPAQLMVIAGVILGTVMVICIVSILLKIFLFNPLKVGGYRFFRKNVENPAANVGIVAEGFGSYGHTFATLFLQDLFLGLWSMLFVIPGIVKSYSYRLVPYLIKDNPELSATETITRSRELMNGHKWEAFVLDLSFIGWYLLGFITLDIVNIFWTAPYHESAKAQFYLNLLERK